MMGLGMEGEGRDDDDDGEDDLEGVLAGEEVLVLGEAAKGDVHVDEDVDEEGGARGDRLGKPLEEDEEDEVAEGAGHEEDLGDELQRRCRGCA